MTIYGSKEIVELLASFERSGATLATKEGMNAILLLVSRMRAESLTAQEELSLDAIKSVIFGIERK